MKVTMIEREISHKLQTGKFEMIAPTLRMRGELDPGEDIDAARKALGEVLANEFNKVLLDELRMVHTRRGGKVVEDDQLPDLLQHVKSMLK